MKKSYFFIVALFCLVTIFVSVGSVNIFSRAYTGVKNSFQAIGKYGSIGTKAVTALITKKPITGFILSSPAQYVGPSKQEYPPSIAQEKALYVQKLKTETDENLIKLYEQEIKVLDIVKKYIPFIYLHPDDLSGPIDPREFFAGQTTAVREGRYNAGKGAFVIEVGKVTFSKLSKLTAQNPTGLYHIWHGKPDNEKIYDRRIFYGSDPANLIPIHVLTYYGKIVASVGKNGKPVYQTDERGYFVPDKSVLYIQYLCLYGYNQPYTITTKLGTLYKGDVMNFQNAHEGDLEHITLKIKSASDIDTGAMDDKLVAIYYGSHGTTNEGLWMYAPGSKGNELEEFAVGDEGRPIVFSAYGGHGNYPKEGVYTRVYGFANDITKKGPLWQLTENNVCRTVLKKSAGYNPSLYYNNLNYFGYLDWKGDLGPRGVASVALKGWPGSIEDEDRGRDAIATQTNHFCPLQKPAMQANATCVRNKSKKSPPPGNKRPWYIEMFQALGVM